MHSAYAALTPPSLLWPQAALGSEQRARESAQRQLQAEREARKQLQRALDAERLRSSRLSERRDSGITRGSLRAHAATMMQARWRGYFLRSCLTAGPTSPGPRFVLRTLNAVGQSRATLSLR